MRIYVWDFTHDRYYPALTTEHTTVGKLLSQITPQLVKERGPGRQIVSYLQKTGEQLYYDPQGRFVRRGKRGTPWTLHPWQTLSSAGVIDNEVLILCYFIQPGAEPTDVEERLTQEQKWLEELTAKSDLIEIESVEGTPPRRYRIILKCKGIMLHPVSKKPCMSARHLFEIYLPAGIPGYPIEAPYVLCLTPHFHPNISQENNMVCLGVERNWESSLDIAWLITHLADMITYRIYGFEKPYNQEAVQWTKDNVGKLPLETRPLFRDENEVNIVTKETDKDKISFEEPFNTSKLSKETEDSEKVTRPKKSKSTKEIDIDNKDIGKS